MTLDDDSKSTLVFIYCTVSVVLERPLSTYKNVGCKPLAGSCGQQPHAAPGHSVSGRLHFLLDLISSRVVYRGPQAYKIHWRRCQKEARLSD